MEAEIRASGASLQRGVLRELFEFAYTFPGHPGGPFHPYAVTADGQRFLFARPISPTATNTAPPPINVVLNWTAALPDK